MFNFLPKMLTFNQFLAYLILNTVGMPMPMLARLLGVGFDDLQLVSLSIGLACQANQYENDDQLLRDIYAAYGKEYISYEQHKKDAQLALDEVRANIKEVCDCPSCQAKKRAGATAAPGNSTLN